jgi:hypothetical protein
MKQGWQGDWIHDTTLNVQRLKTPELAKFECSSGLPVVSSILALFSNLAPEALGRKQRRH